MLTSNSEANKVSCIQVAVGRGNGSAQRHQGFVRDAVLYFLQHLVPVKLAAHNDGLVSVRRQDMFKFFDMLSRETPKFDAASFRDCFKASPACMPLYSAGRALKQSLKLQNFTRRL